MDEEDVFADELELLVDFVGLLTEVGDSDGDFVLELEDDVVDDDGVDNKVEEDDDSEVELEVVDFDPLALKRLVSLKTNCSEFDLNELKTTTHVTANAIKAYVKTLFRLSLRCSVIRLSAFSSGNISTIASVAPKVPYIFSLSIYQLIN